MVVLACFQIAGIGRLLSALLLESSDCKALSVHITFVDATTLGCSKELVGILRVTVVDNGV